MGPGQYRSLQEPEQQNPTPPSRQQPEYSPISPQLSTASQPQPPGQQSQPPPCQLSSAPSAIVYSQIPQQTYQVLAQNQAHAQYCPDNASLSQSQPLPRHLSLGQAPQPSQILFRPSIAQLPRPRQQSQPEPYFAHQQHVVDAKTLLGRTFSQDPNLSQARFSSNQLTASAPASMPMTMALGPGQTEWRVLWTGDVLVSQDNVHRLGQFIVYSTCSYTPPNMNQWPSSPLIANMAPRLDPGQMASIVQHSLLTKLSIESSPGMQGSLHQFAELCVIHGQVLVIKFTNSPDGIIMLVWEGRMIGVLFDKIPLQAYLDVAAKQQLRQHQRQQHQQQHRHVHGRPPLPRRLKTSRSNFNSNNSVRMQLLHLVNARPPWRPHPKIRLSSVEKSPLWCASNPFSSKISIRPTFHRKEP